MKETYKTYLENPWYGDPFIFAIINKEVYIEKIDVINRSYYLALDEIFDDDERSDLSISVGMYFYLNYNSKEIPVQKEIWDHFCNYDDMHVDYLLDNFKQNTEIEFGNTTIDSLQLLKKTLINYIEAKSYYKKELLEILHQLENKIKEFYE